MTTGGLDYSIRKKLDTQHLRDMAQLADRVQHFERLKAEKARTQKYFRKEKVAFVASEKTNQEFDIAFGDVELKEVNIVELKPGLPYTCKLLRPSDGNNPVKISNERYVPKTYTFDVTKCHQIYDLLVVYGQVVAAKDVKIPPLEQRHKRGFCKYRNFFGHNTSRCYEGRLTFGNKPKNQMQVNSDPLKDASMMYNDITCCNMVEAIIDAVENLSIKVEVKAEIEVAECQMVDITKDAEHVKEIAPKPQFDEKLNTTYPTTEEELIDFLIRCKLKNSEVMLCPRCSVVFDKEASKGLEVLSQNLRRRGNGLSYIPFINNSSTTNYVNQIGQGKALVPYAPNQKWVQSTHKNVQHGKNNMVTRNTSVVDNNKNGVPFESRKFVYSNSCKGKNHMTRNQWRRYRRSKKDISTSLEDETVDPNGDQRTVVSKRRPTKERLYLPLIEEDPNEDNELGSRFTDSEPDLDVICNLVSILPAEYDMISEVDVANEEFEAKAWENNRKAIFEQLDDSMKSHLKPLFIQSKVDEVIINKVLVDGGDVVNLMPQSLLKKVGKTDKNLKPHNLIMSSYEGKGGHFLGALRVCLTEGTMVRPTLFMVVPSKANFNLLLGREWIHGIGVVPTSMHQRILIWRDDGTVENIEDDHGYFLAEVNQITRKTFDKNLANIAPCSSAKSNGKNQADASFVRLRPTHGFMWERETFDTKFDMENLNSLTLGNAEDDHHI
ncbi:hypothetical protein MTR_2g461810 [Medicago truncatula]|uniref:Uncharacterized protein n=1 Tax=Medicago truncatula TaxID=3880 RepID=A0A072VIZ3_MEDTR|nr:hypothetical protein MTR_2g461810 [Medicago truncatula]